MPAALNSSARDLRPIAALPVVSISPPLLPPASGVPPAPPTTPTGKQTLLHAIFFATFAVTVILQVYYTLAML